MTYIPPLSSAGIGSGLNVNDIVNKMMLLEQRPLTLLQVNVGSTEAKISAFGKIKAAMSALYDAASTLGSPTTWRGRLLTSSNANAVSGNATSVAGAASSSHFALQVQALAQSQALASGTFAHKTTMGAEGELTLQTGRWQDNNFTAGNDGGNPKKITIATTDTLADVAAKINQAGGDVSAVVVNGAEGERLLVRGTQTGQDNGFAISVKGGGALAALAYDPSTVAAGDSEEHKSMQRTAAAANAQFTVNGLAVSSASNTVQDVVPGINLTLHQTTSAPVDIRVGADSDAIKDKIKAFQEAFNKLGTLLRQVSAYDDKSKKGQPLQGDSTVRQLQGALASLMQRPGMDGTTLASLGLEIKLDSDFRNPSLSLDEGKLKAALTDMPRLEKLLTGDGNGSSNDSAQEGLITRIRDFAFAANGVNGDISTRTKGLDSIKKGQLDAMDTLSERLAQRQANMLRQYQALDAKMATMNSLSSFLTAQIGQWNKG